jgi:hypothetical protein
VKKILIVIIILMLMAQITGCKSINELQEQEVKEDIPEESMEIQPEITPNPTPTADTTSEPVKEDNEEYEYDDYSIDENLLNKDWTFTVIDDHLLLINNYYSFSLMVPSYWEDYFVIKGGEGITNSYAFLFHGDSETGQGYIWGRKYNNGIPMFILEEGDISKIDTSFIDNLTFVGEAHGISFYHYTSTDDPLSLVDEEVEDYEDGFSYYQDVEGEIDRLRSDNKIIKKMRSDFDDLLASFEEIEK